MPFATEATRWSGVWLDSALTLRESRRRSMNRARAAEAQTRRLVSRRGLPPASARNLQNAIVSGTMLYAADLTWDGSKKMEGEVQRTLNRMGRPSLGSPTDHPRLWFVGGRGRARLQERAGNMMTWERRVAAHLAAASRCGQMNSKCLVFFSFGLLLPLLYLQSYTTCNPILSHNPALHLQFYTPPPPTPHSHTPHPPPPINPTPFHPPTPNSPPLKKKTTVF